VAGRVDLHIVRDLIEAGSKALDLGCGDGELLRELARAKGVTGQGIEIEAGAVASCLGKGLVVHHGDIEEGLGTYADASFDYVILSQTLQMTRDPAFVIGEMLRVGRRAIVSVPNFGHYSLRWQLLRGRMPVTRTLPYEWYDTPNIRHTTIRDFERFCELKGFHIEKEVYVTRRNRKRSRLLANATATLGIFVLSGGEDEIHKHLGDGR
jgi:methionine biosynthesis protein MetW